MSIRTDSSRPSVLVIGRYGYRKGSLKLSKSRRSENLLHKSEICEHLLSFSSFSIVTSKCNGVTQSVHTNVALRVLWFYLFKKGISENTVKVAFYFYVLRTCRRGKNVKCPTCEREIASLLSALRNGIDPPAKTAAFEFPNRVDV